LRWRYCPEQIASEHIVAARDRGRVLAELALRERP
jgi:hypothetical protein